MAIGPLVVNEVRKRVVDFTEPFLSIRSSALLLRHPPSYVANASSSFARRGVQISVASSSPASGPLSSLDGAPSSSGINLLLSTDRMFGVVRDGAARRQLEASGDPLHRAAWARLAGFWPSAVVGTVDEGIDRVRRSGGRFVLVADSPAVEYAASRRPCDLASTEPFLERADYAFAIARGDDATLSNGGAAEPVSSTSTETESVSARLRRAVDRQLIRLRRDSTLQALYLKWWRSMCIATMTPSPSVAGGSALATKDRIGALAPSSGGSKHRPPKHQYGGALPPDGAASSSSERVVPLRGVTLCCVIVFLLSSEFSRFVGDSFCTRCVRIYFV